MTLMGEDTSPSASFQVPDKAPSHAEGSALLCLPVFSVLPKLHQHYHREVKLITVCLITRLLLSSIHSL